MSKRVLSFFLSLVSIFIFSRVSVAYAGALVLSGSYSLQDSSNLQYASASYHAQYWLFLRFKNIDTTNDTKIYDVIDDNHKKVYTMGADVSFTIKQNNNVVASGSYQGLLAGNSPSVVVGYAKGGQYTLFTILLTSDLYKYWYNGNGTGQGSDVQITVSPYSGAGVNDTYEWDYYTTSNTQTYYLHFDGNQHISVDNSPHWQVDFGTPSVDCQNHTIDLPLSANFNLTGVSDVKINGQPVNFQFNSDTWHLLITGVVFTALGSNSVNVSFNYFGKSPDGSQDVSGTTSTNVDVSTCVQTSNSTYEVQLSVNCGVDTTGHYYDITVAFLKDGVRVNDYTVTYTSTPVDGQDENVSGHFYVDTYHIVGNPVGGIDNYNIVVSYDSKTFTVDASNLSCGEAYDYDYDDNGNLIKKQEHNILSMLKDILNAILNFFKFIYSFFKLIFTLVKLGLSFFGFIGKWVVGGFEMLMNFVSGFIVGLATGQGVSPFQNFNLNIFGVPIGSLPDMLLDKVRSIVHTVPNVVWVLMSGFIVFDAFPHSGGDVGGKK